MDDATGQETYTTEQRETLESGLCILARMIARAHLQLQGFLRTAGSGGKAGDEAGPASGTAHRDGQ